MKGSKESEGVPEKVAEGDICSYVGGTTRVLQKTA
jgi:hypothetical protein